jgi:hypothetical protein
VSMRLWFNACVLVGSRVMVIVVSFMVLSRFVVDEEWRHCREARLSAGSECARPLTHP